MNEQEAVTIATRFVEKAEIPLLRVERAFFVPLDAFDWKPPGLHESWVVHFRTPPPAEDQFDCLLSDDSTLLIVSVDVETRTPSFMSML
jgi:hypothetical protein